MAKQREISINTAFIPLPGEVTYDLNKFSDRFLYVRERVIKQNRHYFVEQNGLSSATIKNYERGMSDPSYQFVIDMATNDYRPYLVFLITGATGQLPINQSIAKEMPSIAEFKDRLQHLRGNILKINRPKMSKMLNGYSRYNLKNFEAGNRRPGIDFFKLCASSEPIKHYFFWLFWGEQKPIAQISFKLTDVGSSDRSRYNTRVGLSGLNQ